MMLGGIIRNLEEKRYTEILYKVGEGQNFLVQYRGKFLKFFQVIITNYIDLIIFYFFCEWEGRLQLFMSYRFHTCRNC